MLNNILQQAMFLFALLQIPGRKTLNPATNRHANKNSLARQAISTSRYS